MPPRNNLLNKTLLLVTGLVVALSGCSKDLVEALPDAGAPDAAVYGCSAEGTRSNTVFLNRLGGAYTNGPSFTSPSLNQSQILEASVTLEPAGINDTDWEEIMSCVASMLKPYDVAVTDVDPAPSGMLVDHQEIVILKNPTEIGSYYAPWTSPFSCGEIDGIAFAFAYDLENREICESVVGSLGSMAGLHIVADCSDVLSYMTCGDKGITNAEVPCGVFEAEDCGCTGLATQNPHQGFINAYGSCES